MEYEGIGTLATVQDIGRVVWDAMDRYVVIEAMVGKNREETCQMFVALTPLAAALLFAALSDCVLEKAPGEPSVQ